MSTETIFIDIDFTKTKALQDLMLDVDKGLYTVCATSTDDETENKRKKDKLHNRFIRWFLRILQLHK